MPTLNDFYQWTDEHNRLQNIQEYGDLTTEFNLIRARVLSSRRLTRADDLALKNNIITHYNRIIVDGCNGLISKIENRRIKGQLFYDNIKKIKELRRESENTTELEKCHDNFNELKDISARVDEKISSERYILWLFLAGLIIGFILGIIASYISNII